MSRMGYFAAVFAMIALAGCAKVVVVKVPGTTPTEPDGVIYALPNTVVRVKLKVDKNEYTAAPYSTYAAIFAPGGQTICKDLNCTKERQNSFSVEQGVTFTTFGEPDPDNVYLVKFSGGGAIDQTLSLTWNEAGVITGASASVTNRTIDNVMSGLKLAASIGSKAYLGASKVGANQPTCATSADPSQDAKVISILTTAGLRYGQELIDNYCAIDPKDRANLPFNGDLLSNATSAYVARVGPLADAKSKILGLTGTSVVMDPVNLLNTIQTQIDRQLALLYLGSKKTSTWDGTLDVRTLTVGTAIPLLKINPEKGICLGESTIPPVGAPFPTDFGAASADCDKASPLVLTFDYYPAANRQLFTKIKDSVDGDRSFRYRIPAQVKAVVSEGSKTYGAGVFMVAQLGTIVSLPANRHSKTLSYDLAFIEATGGLKSFKLGTAGGLDASTIDALSSVGGTIADTHSTVVKNGSEATALTTEDQMLKLQDDICTIRKKYGLACTVTPK